MRSSHEYMLSPGANNINPNIYLSEEYQSAYYSPNNTSQSLYHQHPTTSGTNKYLQTNSPSNYSGITYFNNSLSPSTSWYSSSSSEASTPANSPRPPTSRSTFSPEAEPQPTKHKHSRVGLHSLNDPEDPNARPAYTNKVLCEYAIKGSPKGKLSLSEIYASVEARFPSMKRPEHCATWRNSARHDISRDRRFVQVPRSLIEPGRGAFWTFDQDAPPKERTSRSNSLSAAATSQPAVMYQAAGPPSVASSHPRYRKGQAATRRNSQQDPPINSNTVSFKDTLGRVPTTQPTSHNARINPSISYNPYMPVQSSETRQLHAYSLGVPPSGPTRAENLTTNPTKAPMITGGNIQLDYGHRYQPYSRRRSSIDPHKFSV